MSLGIHKDVEIEVTLVTYLLWAKYLIYIRFAHAILIMRYCCEPANANNNDNNNNIGDDSDDARWKQIGVE